MASHTWFPVTLLFTFFLFHAGQSASAIPRRHALTIIKDNVKNQYFTTFIVGNPPITFTLLLDLGNLYSWVDCKAYDYKSTTFSPIACGSAKCSAYGGSGCVGCNLKFSPSCTNNTCGGYAYTPWSNSLISAGLIHDNIFLYTRPKGSSKVAQYRMAGFPFACLDDGPLKGMSANTKGVLTLANVNIALHSVVSKNFRVAHKFALCLPSTDTILYKGFEGSLQIGGGPYYMSKGNLRDFSKTLVTTPLVVNPKSTAPISSEGDKSVEYFINVKGIEVGGTPLKIDSSLLSINKNGAGGTKLSTLDPYTVLHSSIYKALVEAFTAKAKAMKIPRVAAVAPFGACYDSRFIANSASGPKVPNVDFILDGPNPRWRMYGASSMVKFFDDKYKNVLCLGFVDGGAKATTSIVIGGKQIEDNIVEVDLESSKVGVTPEPVSLGLSCSRFQSTLPVFETLFSSQ